MRNKLISAPNYCSMKIFTEDLIAIHMKKIKLCLNRPIYCGFTILDNSKMLMYDFHYNYIKKKYNDVKLLFTDTDSLCYEIKTDDIYEDMYNDKHLFDFSDFPKDSQFHNTENKKTIGKFKDETPFNPIVEFVGLRSKMYSIKTQKYESKKAKGIKKSVVKKDIKHENYRDVLLNAKQEFARMNTIRISAHKLASFTINKIGLSCYDDKRYILDGGFDTVAYGHWKYAAYNK